MFRTGFLRFLLVALLCLAALPVNAADPKWLRISTKHFVILTDTEEKKGRQFALRFEQMQMVFAQLLVRKRLTMAEPLEIILLKDTDEYLHACPLRQGQPIPGPGFFLPGDDRNYIVLNATDEDAWRDVSHDFTHLLLEFNYPPTQAWFDEGIAEYISSLRLSDKLAQMGNDPGPGLTEILATQAWKPIPELFAATLAPKDDTDGKRHTLFHAESWMVMHYLINKDKLSETGAYLQMVQVQKLPVDKAIQQAYGMTPAQFEQTVKDYFHALTPALQAPAPELKAISGTPSGPLQPVAAPLGVQDLGASIQPVLIPEADALVAEMTLRIPERRTQALDKLKALISQPKGENAIEHRGIAWVYLQDGKLDDASEALTDASEVDPKDGWTHYYMALVRYRVPPDDTDRHRGLSNMMQDLRAVLDWYPEFAEAYSMLGMARIEGGGVSSATEAMKGAIQLSPRNQGYLLNMAQIDMAAKKWDEATALLEKLQNNADPRIAATAKQNLQDLPTLKKYGVLPQRTAQNTPAKPKPPALDDDSNDRPPAEPAVPVRDPRPVKFLKARLLSVDCSQAPAALLTISAAGKSLRLRTEDYKSLLLIGADDFSCDWKALAVAVNYKPGGKADGDVVSLELQ